MDAECVWRVGVQGKVEESRGEEKWGMLYKVYRNISNKARKQYEDEVQQRYEEEQRERELQQQLDQEQECAGSAPGKRQRGAGGSGSACAKRPRHR